jgi:hypothetical protein
MKRTKCWLIGAIAAFIFLAGDGAAARANVVFGSVHDHRGDGDSPFGVHPNDIASFGILYDSDAGQLTTSIRLHDEFTAPLADYSFGAQIGVWSRARHACDVESTGALTLTVFPSGDAPIDYDTARYSIVGHDGGAEQTFLVHTPLDKRFEPPEFVLGRTRFDRITDVAALAGRGYNCVTNVVLQFFDPGGEAYDTTKSFCMGPWGTIPCPKLRKL